MFSARPSPIQPVCLGTRGCDNQGDSEHTSVPGLLAPTVTHLAAPHLCPPGLHDPHQSYGPWLAGTYSCRGGCSPRVALRPQLSLQGSLLLADGGTCFPGCSLADPGRALCLLLLRDCDIALQPCLRGFAGGPRDPLTLLPPSGPPGPHRVSVTCLSISHPCACTPAGRTEEAEVATPFPLKAGAERFSDLLSHPRIGVPSHRPGRRGRLGLYSARPRDQP